MSRQDPTSRAKPKPEGEEEATSVLNLGEFENVDALSLSEASIIINAVLAKRKKEGRNMKQNDLLPQSLTYLDTFARFKKKENIEAVERLLNAHPELAKFEKAQLGTYGSLCCGKADEAKTIIPSLADKISDDDLQELLDEISELMSDS